MNICRIVIMFKTLTEFCLLQMKNKKILIVHDSSTKSLQYKCFLGEFYKIYNCQEGLKFKTSV